MSLIKPFAALRPVATHSTEVVAPPYDVMNRAEAKQMVVGRPWSFLHISRPEIDLPDEISPYAEAVYTQGRDNLAQMQAAGILAQDDSDCYYVYRLTMGEHVQTGIVAVASVAAYNADRIKKHEYTRPVKEQDRVQQITTLNAQTGPVFLVYSAQATVDGILAETAQTTPAVDVTADDGVRHQLWVIQAAETIATLTAAFEAMPALYVADGHHRSAAAARVAEARQAASLNDEGHQNLGNEPYHYFLSVIFPHDQMQILDYNRVIRDLNGLSADEFLARVAERFNLQAVTTPSKPTETTTFGMYLNQQWYALQLRAEYGSDDPVGGLDISLLTDNLIEPVLGISDPRRDERIDFIGGIRGLKALEQRVDSGEWAIAFALHPVAMSALMDVADSGEVMPPKSTWFEPKLADGLVSHLLSD